MPLTFGIPLGLVIAVVGLLLLLFKRKGLALTFLGIGVLMVLVTLLVSVIAANSM